MGTLILFVILFLCGTIYNFYIGDNLNAVGDLIIAIFLFAIFYNFVSEEQKSEKFIKWIYKNKDDIYAETAIYNGIRITPDLEITQYQVCISFLLFSVKLSSRFFILDYHFTMIINLIYSFITLIFGWWALPFGPIYTIQVLYRNIRGGKKITVDKLFMSQRLIEK